MRGKGRGRGREEPPRCTRSFRRLPAIYSNTHFAHFLLPSYVQPIDPRSRDRVAVSTSGVLLPLPRFIVNEIESTWESKVTLYALFLSIVPRPLSNTAFLFQSTEMFSPERLTWLFWSLFV
jgi:hypothetical protein